MDLLCIYMEACSLASAVDIWSSVAIWREVWCRLVSAVAIWRYIQVCRRYVPLHRSFAFAVDMEACNADAIDMEKSSCSRYGEK
jgi:hypothetical protein